MGWHHRRKRSEPVTGKAGQPGNKAETERKGHEGREDKSLGNCCTVSTSPPRVERYCHAHHVYP